MIPLRNPGEALLQRRMLMVMEEIGIWIIAIGIFGIFTALEWLRWFSEMPPRPYVSTAILLMLGIVGMIHVWRVLRKIRNYDLGLLGERYMGERLSELYADGYHIIHDVPCGKMNIDHVIIGPAGIFTIETKMARKEVDQLNEITHTDKGVLMNGKRGWAGKAVWEAQKEVEYLQGILTKEGGACPPIQPIVVYPGWYVTDDCSRKVRGAQ